MKKAYNQLMDEKRSQLCVALIESAQSDVKEARRKLVRYNGGRGAASMGDCDALHNLWQLACAGKEEQGVCRRASYNV